MWNSENTFTVRLLALGETRVETTYLASTLEALDEETRLGEVSGGYGLLSFVDFPKARVGDTVFMKADVTYLTEAGGTETILDTVLLVTSQGGGAGGSGGASGFGGAGGTGRTGSSADGTAAISSADSALTAVKTIASVVPMDEALISVSIDELDILSLHVGDAAQVTVDALPGRVFDGVVTAVNTGRSNSGGNSKYFAEVTVPRTADMFDGMNASCLVTIETFRDVLSIPAAALCDEGGTRLVYTALSRDKSELSNPVPIEPGFSDGETLEVLSGLSEGDTVWFKTFDTPEYSVPKSQSSGGGLGSLTGGRSQRPLI